MLCKSLGHLCGCDGTFLFPQANGHVSQDQEEPVYPEGTARAPAEDETQVGALLGSVPLPSLLRWCSEAVIRSLSANSEAEREKSVYDKSPSGILLSGVECSVSVPSKLFVC